MKPVFICLLGFLTAVVFVAWVYNLLTHKRQYLRNRMKTYLGTERILPDREIKKEPARSGLSHLGDRVTRALAGKVLISKQLEKELKKADIPLRGDEFFFIWLLSALLPGSFFLLVTGNVIFGVACYITGVLLPPLFVRQCRRQRLKTLTRQIGDSLVIISNALRAGQSFQQALGLVSRELTGPIAREFAKTVREIHLGTPLEDALSNLNRRVESKDLDLLVTAILIQRQVGGNLAEILDNIAETIRERIRIQGEIRTITAQGRISGLVISLIPPALFVIVSLMNPTFFEPLFNTSFGLVLITLGVVAQVIGVLLIRRIINIDV